MPAGGNADGVRAIGINPQMRRMAAGCSETSGRESRPVFFFFRQAWGCPDL